MDYADPTLVTFLRIFTPRANLTKLIHDHAPDQSGHCSLCHCVGPCTIWNAALDARHRSGPA